MSTFPGNVGPGKPRARTTPRWPTAHAAEVAFGNVDDRPDDASDRRCGTARRRACAHAFDDIAFENDAVPRRGPDDRDRDVAGDFSMRRWPLRGTSRFISRWRAPVP